MDDGSGDLDFSVRRFHRLTPIRFRKVQICSVPSLPLELVQDVTNGTLAFDSSTGNFTYTPATDFVGTDTFTYEVSDGIASSIATVTIDVAASQTLSLTAIEDAWIDLSDNANHGQDPSLFLHGQYYNDNGFVYDDPQQLGFVKFDLSSFDGVVHQAELELHRIAGVTATGNIRVYEVTDQSWAEDSLTSANNPNRGTLVGTDSFTYNDSHAKIDLTTYVRSALVTGQTTISFAITSDAYSHVPLQLVTDENPNLDLRQRLTLTGIIDQNNSPVATDDAYATVGGIELIAGLGSPTGAPSVVANDSDPDRNAISLELVQDVANGTLVFDSSTGDFTYTPATDFVGTDTFTYNVSDGLATVSAVVTIHVAVAQSLAFTAIDDSWIDQANINANYGQDESFSLRSPYYNPDAVGFLKFDLSGFDGDAYQVKLELKRTNSTSGIINVFEVVDQNWTEDTLTNSNAPDRGAVLGTGYMNSTNTIIDLTSYVHEALTGGQTTLSLAVASTSYYLMDLATDENSHLDLRPRLTLTGVINQNTPPVAVSESYSTVTGVPLVAGLNSPTGDPGVAANDSDPDGNAILLELVQDVANGTLVFDSSTGDFNYTPNANFIGTDSFIYEVSDGLGSSTATVTIEVSAAQVLTLSAIEDAWIDKSNQAANHGQDDTLVLRSNDVPDESIAFLKFNLAAFDGTAHRVELEFSRTTSQSRNVEVSEVTDQNWTEDSLSWNNAPSIGQSIGTINLTTPTTLDVTSMVRQALADGQSTLSLAIAAIGSEYDAYDNPWFGIASDEHSQVDFRPRLTLTGVIDTTPSVVNDHRISILEDQTRVLTMDDFPHWLPDRKVIEEVELSTTPGSQGALLLDSQPIDNGTRVSIEDIDSGLLTFVPSENDFDSEYGQIQFRTIDAAGVVSDNQALLLIDVLTVNDAPTSQDHQLSVLADDPYVFVVSDFPFDDIDPDSNNFAGIRIESLPSRGMLLIDGEPIVATDLVSRHQLRTSELVFISEFNSQVDHQTSFAFSVSDGYSFSSEASEVLIDVAVSQAGTKVTYDVILTDLLGTPITSVDVGDPFLAKVYATETYPFNSGSGIYSAFVDLVYDSSLVSVANVGIDSEFSGNENFDLTTLGVIANAGGTVPGTAATTGGGQPQLLITAELIATNGGVSTISAMFPDLDAQYDTLVFGVDTHVPRSEIDFTAGSMTINPSAIPTLSSSAQSSEPLVVHLESTQSDSGGSPPGQAPDGASPPVHNPWHNYQIVEDVNGNKEITALDALLIINQIARLDSSGTNVLPPTNDSGFFYDVTNNGEISALDALRVINELARIGDDDSGGDDPGHCDSGGDDPGNGDPGNDPSNFKIESASIVDDQQIHEGNGSFENAVTLTGTFSQSPNDEDEELSTADFDIEVWIDSNFSCDFEIGETNGRIDGDFSSIYYDSTTNQGTFSYLIFGVPDDGVSASASDPVAASNHTSSDSMKIRLVAVKKTSSEDSEIVLDTFDLTAEVVNEDPYFTLPPGLTFDTNAAGDTVITVSARFADPGPLDRHRLVISWGDGGQTQGDWSGDNPITAQRIIPAGEAVPSLYPITVTLEDDDTGTAEYKILGADVLLNDDDDDENDVADLNDDAGPGVGIPQEDDLVAISLGELITDEMDAETGTFILEYGGGIRVWDSADKKNLFRPYNAPIDGIDYVGQGTVYVEGIALGTGTITLSWQPDDEGNGRENPTIFGGEVLVRVRKDFIPKLYSVTFEGEHEITGDPAPVPVESAPPNLPWDTLYDDQHWLDKNLDGDSVDVDDRQWPVAYTRNNTLIIGAVIELDSDWTGGDIYVKADGPDEIKIKPEKATVIGKMVKISGKAANRAFPNHVKHYDNFVLSWEISFDGKTTWQTVGASSNDVYLTLKDPAVLPLHHTLVHIGSSIEPSVGGTGVDAEDDLIDAVWDEYTDKSVSRVDGTQLTYYKSYVCRNKGTVALLKHGDGQCGSWAKFFLDVLKAQGIVRTNNYVIVKSLKYLTIGEGILIKNWSFIGQGSSGHPDLKWINVADGDMNFPPVQGPANNSYVWDTFEVRDDTGEAGQGNDNPASLFYNHQFVQLTVHGTTKFYDPSYGITYTSLIDFDDNHLAGFFAIPQNNPPNKTRYVFRKNPNGLDIAAEITTK